jgi:hypothetical protein
MSFFTRDKTDDVTFLYILESVAKARILGKNVSKTLEEKWNPICNAKIKELDFPASTLLI